MDLELRILKREAEQKSATKVTLRKYIRALERVADGVTRAPNFRRNTYGWLFEQILSFSDAQLHCNLTFKNDEGEIGPDEVVSCSLGVAHADDVLNDLHPLFFPIEPIQVPPDLFER